MIHVALVVAGCVAFHPVVHPGIRSAFERHDRSSTGALEPRQVRRALADLGADVSMYTAQKLVEDHGDVMCVAKRRKRVSVEALACIVEQTAVASPAMFWLWIDPEGTGVRRTRQKWNRFARAGMASPVRIAHYGVGLASLVVGATDYLDCVVHLGVPAVGLDAAVAHGALHTAAAILSLPRFRYGGTEGKPHYLWFGTARDANMWPSFLVFAWYTLAMASDFVQPVETAALASGGPNFLALTHAVNIATLYGAGRTACERETVSGVYASPVANVLQVVWGMVIAVMVDTVKCLVVTHDPAVYHEYTQFVALHPIYTQIVVGTMLSGLFIGNLACALSSAEHYKALTKSQIGDLTNALVTVSNTASVFAMCRAEDGALVLPMLHLLADGLKTLLPTTF